MDDRVCIFERKTERPPPPELMIGPAFGRTVGGGVFFLNVFQPANFAFSRAATGGGTNGVTSPPMDAICLTSVAVIGRTAGEAGRNTVCTSAAITAFMPAISIS